VLSVILGGGLLVYLIYRFCSTGLFTKENTRFSWENELSATGGGEDGLDSNTEGGKGRARDISNSSTGSRGFQFGDVYNPTLDQGKFSEKNMKSKQNEKGTRSQNEQSDNNNNTRTKQQQQQQQGAVPVWRWLKIHGLHK